MSKSKNAKVQAVTADFFLVNPEKLLSCPNDTLDRGLREIQRELWVRKWYEKAQLYRTFGREVVVFRGFYTIVTIFRDDQVAPHMGWAKRSPSDTKSDRVGIAVATARAFGEDIPDYI